MKLIFAFVTCALFTQIGYAQDTTNSPQESKLETMMKVFPLKHARAEEIGATIDDLVGRPWNMAIDSRLNQIIFEAPAPTLKKISDVIAVLDVELEPKSRTASPHDIKSEIIQVMNRRAADLMDTISLHINPAHLRIDDSTNMILASGTEAVLAQLRNSLKTVDVSSPTMRLQFMVLGAGGEALPNSDDFQKLTKELAALSLSGYGLSNRIAVNCMAGSNFTVNGQVASGSSITVEGNVLLKKPNGTAIIQVRGQIQHAGNEPKDMSSASIHSTLEVPLGDIMIVGMSPASGNPSQPLILVVRADA